MAGAQHRCGMQAGDFDFTTLDMGCLSEHPAPECVHRERSGAGGSRGPRRAATPSSRLCEPPPAPRSGAIPRPPSRPSPLPRLLGPPPSFLSLPPQSLLLARPVRARDCLPRSSLESRGLWVSHRSVCAHLCASPSLYQSLSAYLCLSVCLFLGLIAVSVRQSISPSGPGVAAGRAGRDERRLHELRERRAGGGAWLQLPAAGGRGGRGLLLRLPRPQVLLRRPAQLLPLRAQLHVVAQVPALALTPPSTPRPS